MTLLTTPRLLLRPFTAVDIDRLLGMTGGAQILGWLAVPERSRTPDAAEWLTTLNADHARGAGSKFAMELRRPVPVDGPRIDSLPGAFVGTVGLSRGPAGAELWVWLLPRYWNRKLAQEAVHGICTHAFAPPAPAPPADGAEEASSPGLGLDSVLAYTAPGNERSMRMLERVGFRQIPQPRDHFPGREKGTGRMYRLMPSELVRS